MVPPHIFDIVPVVIAHVRLKEKGETFVDVVLGEAPDWPFGRDLDFGSAFVKLQCAHTQVFSHNEREF